MRAHFVIVLLCAEVGLALAAGSAGEAKAKVGAAAAGGEEKVLLAGPWRGSYRYYPYMPLGKPYRPWKIDWENYLYKDFYPCVADNHLGALPAGGRPLEKLLYYNEGTRGATVQAHNLLALHFGEPTSKDAAKCYPRQTVPTADWSGYDFLRLDVRFTGPTHVWWAIEDEVLQPPVVGNFDPKPGAWTTLQIDLAAAAKDRGLNLARMWTMWLRANPDGGSSGELANLRLARRAARAAYPVLDDPNASKLPPHPARQGPPKPDSPRDLAPLAGPVTLEYRSATPLTFSGPPPAPGLVVAYDARRVLLIAGDRSYKWYDYRSEKPGMERQEVFAVQTLDGGATWTGLDGDKERSWQHVAVRPVARVIDEQAGAVLWNKDGCGNNPGPRHRIIKFSFTGKAGWTFNRKDHVFNEENYHCGNSLDDAVRTKGGRVWAAFAIAHRLFDPASGLHAKYSDSDAVAWHTWREGRIATVPGGEGGGRPLVVPYGDHVGVLFMKDADNKDLHYFWTVFDGKDWSTPQAVHGKYVHSAVAVGEKDVLISHGHYWGKRTDIPAGGKAGVKRFDGTRWTREVDGVDAGELCVTGRSVAAVNAYGENFIVRWRSPEGKWDEKPQTIPAGGPVGEWRTSRFCPPNLVPVACIPKADPKTIKVLLVPNPHFKAP